MSGISPIPEVRSRDEGRMHEAKAAVVKGWVRDAFGLDDYAPVVVQEFATRQTPVMQHTLVLILRRPGVESRHVLTRPLLEIRRDHVMALVKPVEAEPQDAEL